MAAAAFGRLCVETSFSKHNLKCKGAAAFGRLCVETGDVVILAGYGLEQPPSGGCVLKHL